MNNQVKRCVMVGERVPLRVFLQARNSCAFNSYAPSWPSNKTIPSKILGIIEKEWLDLPEKGPVLAFLRLRILHGVKLFQRYRFIRHQLRAVKLKCAKAITVGGKLVCECITEVDSFICACFGTVPFELNWHG